MRKNFGAQPYLYPQPVMIIGTYDENGKANAMNAAWGGIVGRDEIMIDLSSHKTTKNLEVTKVSFSGTHPVWKHSFFFFMIIHLLCNLLFKINFLFHH